METSLGMRHGPWVVPQLFSVQWFTGILRLWRLVESGSELYGK